MKKINLAIVGATGLVGGMFLKVLEEKQNIKIRNIFLYASERSAGKDLRFRGENVKVELLSEDNIKNKKIDYALFSAGASVSKQYAKTFKDNGAIVIDNSSAWRMDANVPLVVPQVNKKACHHHKGLIANPNCSTIQIIAPLKVLDDLFGLKNVSFTTFQAVSGSGMKGIKDLESTRNMEPPRYYPHPIHNNCLPHVDSFLDNGFTKEEMKMVNETRKILEKPRLKISATCVRVPVENAHSISVVAKFKKKVDVARARDALRKFESIVVLDNPDKAIYPIATMASGTDKIFVGRLRKDLFDSRVVHFFCVADNVRKGAASNAIEILEFLENNN